MNLILFTDGASRGNPGPAAYGVVLADPHGQVVTEFGRIIGHATNNEAEYRGLLAGLDAASRYGATDLEIRLDSELLVQQLNGQFKVRAPNLKPLLKEAQDKLSHFKHVEISHVPRALNSRADRLANQALDRSSSS